MNGIYFLFARAAMGAIFLWFGLANLFALEGSEAYIASAGVPFPALALWGAIVLEVGAGAALLAGFRLFYAAGALTIFTLATAALFHADLGDEDQLTHFLKNIAMAGGLAYLALVEWKSGRPARA